MGKVLAVGGNQQKIRAACDAGVKEILLPADNLKEAQELPSYILDTRVFPNPQKLFNGEQDRLVLGRVR
jgi:ATP-dependent Lon protease